MLLTGRYEVLEDRTKWEKGPSFDTNDQFDTSVFHEKFDVFLARSIWTHALKGQIEVMLDNFLRDSTPNAFFLTSYLPAKWPWQDYKGSRFAGKSHTSTESICIRHRFSWIRKRARFAACMSRRWRMARSTISAGLRFSAPNLFYSRRADVSSSTRR